MSRRSFGVAVGLPEPYTSQLQDWRERLGDPMASGIPPHVTLLPPTDLSGDAIAEVEEHLRAVAAREHPFRLRLAGSDTFRPVSPVVFVAVAEGDADCGRLEAQVRSGPLARELSFPYHPHVTVAHDLDEPALDVAVTALADYEAVFMVEAFTLFEQDVAGVWRPQRDFRLGGGGLPGPEEP